jgi:hypothetical protein
MTQTRPGHGKGIDNVERSCSRSNFHQQPAATQWTIGKKGQCIQSSKELQSAGIVTVGLFFRGPPRLLGK